jgi:hypothetical protein
VKAHCEVTCRENSDIGIGEMTRASTDHGGKSRKRRESRSRRAAKRAYVGAVSTEELATLDMFADIPAHDLAALAANLEHLHAAAGEILMRQGEKAESFSIIASGRVEIRHTGGRRTRRRHQAVSRPGAVRQPARAGLGREGQRPLAAGGTRVITTTGDIPALDDLPLDHETRLQIQHVARQMIHAFD